MERFICAHTIGNTMEDMTDWSRPLVHTKDQMIYRAYATYSERRIFGVYKLAIETLLEKDNLEYVDGEIVEKMEQ